MLLKHLQLCAISAFCRSPQTIFDKYYRPCSSLRNHGIYGSFNFERNSEFVDSLHVQLAKVIASLPFLTFLGSVCVTIMFTD